MKKGLSIGVIVGVGIFVIILAMILITSPKSNVIEVEDTLDREVNPEVENPEIQEKIDEIEKINWKMNIHQNQENGLLQDHFKLIEVNMQ